MIQIINYSDKLTGEIRNQHRNITFTGLGAPQSLDEFEINILDLRNEGIYRNDEDNRKSVNCINDFISIGTMIKNSTNAKNIIIIPQNVLYKYYYGKSDKQYYRTSHLKDMIYSLKNSILIQIHENFKLINLLYENTRTKVAGEDVNASFYFDAGESILTKSNMSCKPTTIKVGELIMTTLDFVELKDIINFLNEINLIQTIEEVPEWMNQYKMFDDTEQYGIIEENNDIIKESQENIGKALNVIKQNDRYKSILYTNGDELVEVAFEILEKILGCNLSDFNDDKKEDFAVELDGKHFIGEIKGVTSNVKSEHVSQLDVHYQSYLETNDLNDEDVFAILIINHQRNKSLEVREPIHENQIKLSKRNGSLIIETITLLKLFEKFKRNEISTDKCRELLSNNIGLLSINS